MGYINIQTTKYASRNERISMKSQMDTALEIFKQMDKDKKKSMGEQKINNRLAVKR
jgi:hypothetical protein